MTASYTMLGFAIFGGICFAVLVVFLIAYICYRIYNSYDYRIFKTGEYRQACDDWNVLQKSFVKKYSIGKYPKISLKFKLPFPSGKNISVVSKENGRLYFGQLDCYEFCLFVGVMKELQEQLNILQL